MAHAFKDEIGRNAGCARLQVHASGTGEEEVAHASEEWRRRKARHVAVDGREQGIAEGASRGVEQGRGLELGLPGDEYVVDALVEGMAVAAPVHVAPGGAGGDGARQGQACLLEPEA